MDERKNWGLKIKELREERGLTQAELEAKSGVSRSHISRIEKGHYKSPKIELLAGFARGLGLTPETLNRIISGKQVPVMESVGDLIQRIQTRLVALPVHSEAYFHAGGQGMEPISEYVYLEGPLKPGQNVEAYKVLGHCMEPLISPGDTIIINTNASIELGDIVACEMRGVLKIAKLKVIDGEKYLENGSERVSFNECARPSKIIQINKHLP